MRHFRLPNKGETTFTGFGIQQTFPSQLCCLPAGGPSTHSQVTGCKDSMRQHGNQPGVESGNLLVLCRASLILTGACKAVPQSHFTDDHTCHGDEVYQILEYQVLALSRLFY